MKKSSLMVAVFVLLSLLFVGLNFIPEARATTLYVGGAGPGNYTTIQEAIDTANPGDTVFVFNGTYNEQLTISKALSLVGEARDTTIIRASSPYYAVRILADWVNITMFTIGVASTPGASILLDSVSDCRIANNTLKMPYAIWSSHSSSIVMTNNTMVKSGILLMGTLIEHFSTHTIKSNTANGKPVYYWRNITGGVIPVGAGQVILVNCTQVRVENQNLSMSSVGIQMSYSSDIVLSGNNLSHNVEGIRVVFSDNVTVINNTAYDTIEGMILQHTNNVTISENDLLNCTQAIYLWFSANATVSDNNLSGILYGIDILFTNSSVVQNNTFLSNRFQGIMNRLSNNNSIIGNVVSDSWVGIGISDSKNTTLKDNVMFRTGIDVSGRTLGYWNAQDIDTSNTVNGKPVYYWKDSVGGQIPFGAGQVILANCSGVVVKNQNISVTTVGVSLGYSSLNTITRNTVFGSHTVGIELGHSDSNTISENHVSGSRYYGVQLYESHWNSLLSNTLEYNWVGIHLSYSSNNMVAANNVSNSEDGIFVQESAKNTVAENSVFGNDDGIHLHYAFNNSIENNTAYSNDIGIYVRQSDGNALTGNNVSLNNFVGIGLNTAYENKVYHNMLIGNPQQATDNTDTNEWDNGYPSGGNYWSDYTGNDWFSGPNQDQPGSDGIGDTPRVIDADSLDRFPLVGMRSEFVPPEIEPVLLNGKTSQTYVLPDVPLLILTAVLDESDTGGSGIGGSNFTLGPYNWSSSSPMYPSDGAFDSQLEVAYVEISVPDEPGTYDYCVYAWDGEHNINITVTACSQLILMAPPTQPMMLDALLYGPGLRDIRISWARAADDGAGENDIMSYDVFRSTDVGGPYGLVASVLANGSPSYEWTCLDCGVGDPNNYFLYVEANDSLLSTASPNKVGKFTHPLFQGPNLVSIPVILSDESIDHVLQTVMYDRAWAYDSSSQEWKSHMRFKSYGTLEHIDHTMGLWVNVTTFCSLTVAGIVPAQTTIHLYEGWNLVSFPSFNASYTIADLKAEVGATRAEGFESVSPYYLRVLGDGEVLLTGYGYWVKVEADVDWIVEVS